jgi:hypothetical protein
LERIPVAAISCDVKYSQSRELGKRSAGS